MPTDSAVLLTNLGTPDALDRAAVKRFLGEFLSDPLVVRLPRLFWLPLLHGVILPIRSGKTLAAYQRIWSADGSPLLHFSTLQRDALRRKLGKGQRVEIAMRYGNPSFAAVLETLRDGGIERLVVLPLYPQYSVTTTATSYKHLQQILQRLDWQPQLEFIGYYFDHPAYIAALADSVREHWRDDRRHLLMSFHGLPQANVDRGDPYQKQCRQSARLLAAELELADGDWSIGYQSRFGRQAWIQPYTSTVLEGLAARGIDAVDVVCPGFAADCLETLDEIRIEYRREFLDLGGRELRYIDALNANAAHIDMMATLVGEATTDTASPDPD